MRYFIPRIGGNSVFCLLPLLIFIAGCGNKEAPKQGMPPRIVKMAQAKVEDVPIFVDSFGNLNPINNTNLVSQVTGQIMGAHFVEGQEVKEGDILFTIDKSTYQAQLDQALGTLGEDQASLKLNKDTMERNRVLAAKNIVSAQDFEKYVSEVQVSEAKIVSDKAAVEVARINLGYCDVRAPVAGITGKRLVDVGNTITGNNGPTLVNIKTISSLYVDFSIPERYLKKLRTAMDTGELKVKIMPVYEGMTAQNTEEFEGTLKLLDNAVDTQTGTIPLRAIVDNKASKLWAGQFIRVRLVFGYAKDSLVVPSEAIRMGPDGYYVFGVSVDVKGKTAKMIPVKISGRDDDLAVISEGDIKAGDSVITMGLFMLADGINVMTPEESAEMMKKMMQQKAGAHAKTGGKKPASGAAQSDGHSGQGKASEEQAPVEKNNAAAASPAKKEESAQPAK